MKNAGEYILLKCRCFKEFSIKLARVSQYQQFKKILDKGRHPAFIGRNTFESNARNGGASFYLFNNEIIGVTLCNARLGVLIALNVIPNHRGHRCGQAIVNYLMPNFVRSIESKIKFFKNLGYISIGEIKKGISLNTQIMVRANLIKLAGRIKNIDKIN